MKALIRKNIHLQQDIRDEAGIKYDARLIRALKNIHHILTVYMRVCYET